MTQSLQSRGAKAVFSIGLSCALLAAAQDVLPRPEPPFRGQIDVSRDTSKPDWPSPPSAPANAPNVILILVDDVGFGATSTFGGPALTPVFDKLAAQGLRYNAFHVNALCSPSRAALLSGRNSHQVGFGSLADLAAGYPGYNALWPRSAASIAEVLRLNGYSTAAFGKWHNTPFWQISPVGPFDRWPTGLGFDYFYGFMAGADNQYYTRLYRNTSPVEPPATPEQGYQLTKDIESDAVRWLHEHDAVAPDTPFFLYFAPGATHTPHHVSKEWIDKYKGRFDLGWDKVREETFARQKETGVIPPSAELTPRSSELPAWNSLSADEKRLLAHQMEVYAAFVSQTDYEIGKLLDAVKAEGKSDNTLVLEIFGDNGGSAEGGLLGTDAHNANGSPKDLPERLQASDALGSELFMNHYAAAWGWSTSTPFQGAKRDAAHLGGSRDPLVVSWPARIKTVGQLRRQFEHLIDIAPTIYEAAGIQPPSSVNGVKQIPLSGSSFVSTFDNPGQPSKHTVQYFEMIGNYSIYKDGWWAGVRNSPPWATLSSASSELEATKGRWELYNLNQDFSQAHDLAAKDPEKLKELQTLFDSEARRNQVYPIVSDFANVGRGKQPSPTNGRTTFVYRDGVDRLGRSIAPVLSGRAHIITADVDVPANGQGVIFAQGSRYGGFTLYLKQGHVVYEVTSGGQRSGQIVSPTSLAAGKAQIRVEVTPDGSPEPSQQPASPFAFKPCSGHARLIVNGHVAAEAHFSDISPYGLSETLDVGKDLGSAVSPEYAVPFAFTGRIETVTIKLL